MFSRKKLSISIISIIILITNLTFADWRENARAIKVSGGEDHTLVLTENNTAWACGLNGGNFYRGVLGTGSDNPSLIETTLVRVHDGDMMTASEYLEDITDIGAGWVHSLALDVNGFVWAWGNNESGQLGVGEETPYYSTVPVQVHGGEMGTPYLRYIIAIAAGRSGQHSLAVDANNLVYAWGRNYEGQCGNGTHGTGQRELVPVKVLGVGGIDYLANIITVSAGEDHSMGLENLDPTDPNCKGQVYTWGGNAYGKLGIGNTYPSRVDTPVQVLKGQQDISTSNYLENIVAISAGYDHCMALEKYDSLDPNYKGRVYAWGRNSPLWPYSFHGGQLGNGTTDSNSTPVLVLKGEQDNSTSNYLEYIVAVAAGEGHSMALDVNGFGYTWGDNYYGQLGNGTNDPCTRPVKVVGPDLNHNGIHEPNEGYLKNIVAISAGFWHCLAIDADGNIWTWGEGHGRLGLGDTDDKNIPCRIPVVYNITQEKFYFRIQDAINEANNDDVIEASTGIFHESINFLDKSITLRSTNPNNWNIVENTIIDGSDQQSSNLVRFNNNSGSVLSGFTLQNAPSGALDSAAVHCLNSSDITITNCRVRHNINHYGIYGNNSQLIVSGCTIEDNGGDGIYDSYTPSTTITNNIIRGNGGNGIYCEDILSGPEIKNNWIYENGNDIIGSGIRIYNDDFAPDVNVIIMNNTIVKNAGYGTWSLYSQDANITNCIIYYNGTDPNDNLYSYYSGTFDVTYSCVDGTYPGVGNIDDDPCFVDDANDDYHLTYDSNCADAGDPNFSPDANETDIDGNPRVMGTYVDIGGDEDFAHCHPDYNDWVVMGRPNCWLTPYQCAGDADCATEGVLKWRVALNDLNLIISNWKKKVGDSTLNPCADIDHKSEGWLKWRVALNDLNIIIANWKKKDADLPGDCVECQQYQKAQGKVFTWQGMIKWIEQVWLEEETQKLIDEDLWLKFMESLKEEL